MAVTIWLLTSQNAEGKDGREFLEVALQKAHWHGEMPTVLALEDLHRKYRYDEATGEGVKGLEEPYHLWNFGVLSACLCLARDNDELPDLLECGSTHTIGLAQEFLLDITEIALSSEVSVPSKFMNRASLSCRPEPGQPHQSRYFAIPLTVDCRVVFYNTAWLNESSFQSWDTFVGAGSGSKSPWFGLVTGDALHDLLPLIWSLGGDVISAIDLRPRIKSRATVDALTRIARLAARGAIPLQGDQRIQSLEQAKGELVKENDDGVLVASASYYFFELLEREGKLDKFAATLPPGDWCRASFVGGTNLAVANKYGDDIRHEDYKPAIELLEFLCADVRRDRSKPEKLTRDPFETPENSAAWLYNVGDTRSRDIGVGKLPPQLVLWKKMRDIHGHDRTAPFTNALLVSPPEFRLPSIYQMGKIEDFLKNDFTRFWDGVRDEISRAASTDAAVTAMSEVVHKWVNVIHEHLEWLLEGLVTVRHRPVPTGDEEPRFVYGGLQPKPLTDDMVRSRGVVPRHLVLTPLDNAEEYPLIVDEDRRQVRVYMFPEFLQTDGFHAGGYPDNWRTIPFDDLGEDPLDLLLSLVHSEHGRIELPRPSRRDLEDLEKVCYFIALSFRVIELLGGANTNASGGGHAVVRHRLQWNKWRLEIARMFAWLTPPAPTRTRRVRAMHPQGKARAAVGENAPLMGLIPAIRSGLEPPSAGPDPYQWPVTGNEQRNLVDALDKIIPILEDVAMRFSEEIHRLSEEIDRSYGENLTQLLAKLRDKLGEAIIPRDSPGRLRASYGIPRGIGIYHVAPVAVPEMERCPVCHKRR